MASYELPWDGTPLEGPLVAFDTETEIVGDEDARRVPRIALATASAVGRDVVLRPDQLRDFFLRHRSCEWAGFSFSFDFWVVHEYLGGDCQFLWDDVEAGKWHDGMLLDQLVNLALGRPAYRRNLGKVAREHAGLEVDKASPYRRRFAELIGREDEWPSADPGFFEYAAGDTRAQLTVVAVLLRKAAECCERAGLGKYTESLWREFGVLTEQVQVKSSVALAAASQTGLRIDHAETEKVAARLGEQIEADLAVLAREYSQLFRWEGLGSARRVKRIKHSVSPTLNQKELGRLLGGQYRERQEAAAAAVVEEAPRTSRGISTSLKVWQELMPHSEFVQRWGSLSTNCKLLQFITGLRSPSEAPTLFHTEEQLREIRSRPKYTTHLRPLYDTLKDTGRCGCYDPNLQQWPRKPWMRAVFVADPGWKLVVADYGAIELVTLAAVCLKRFGRSRLAEVLRAGVDPHAYTAALMAGLGQPGEPVPVVIRRWEEFAQRDKEGAKRGRQAAKPVNFGVPGGLGDEALMVYAKLKYDVDRPLGEWTTFRDRLINEIYPEIGRYLTDDALRTLAINLGCSRAELTAAFGFDRSDVEPPWFGLQVKKIVSGRPYTKDRKPYNQRTVDKVWQTIEDLAGDGSEEWKVAVRHREGSPWLGSVLFADRCVTLTGRIRSNIEFTQKCNTPFQGAAADGAKLAMWQVVRQLCAVRRWRYCGFIHDELITSAPSGEAGELARQVEEVMVREMARCIQCDIPVKVAVEVSDRWEKP